MKVKICNLGVIKEAEIEVKPLTVFIGHNNTGKSWTAYSLAAILGEFCHQRYFQEYLAGNTQQKYPPLEEALQELIDQGFAQFNLIEFAQDYLELYFNDVAKFAPQWMNSYLATTRRIFEDFSIKINFQESLNLILQRMQLFGLDSRLGVGQKNTEGMVKIFKESHQNNTVVYINSKQKETVNELSEEIIRDFFFNGIFQFLSRILFTNIYTFPIERSTYITIPFLFNELSPQMRQDLKSIKPIISDNNNFIAEPINNLIKSFSNISKIDIYKRQEKAEKNPEIYQCINLAKDLEEMLRGKLSFESNEGTKDLLFQTSDDVKLEMPIVSSMVKELAPLVLYLRYLAEPNDLIVIDEPEMNLHPATQVEIIEFLAMLVNADLNVLITTHSPYIVDHLVNLMKAAKHEDPESIKERFYLEKTEAFISQDKVSVYLFEDGTAKNILDENGYIDWGTFGNVSDDVSHIFP